jgi:long-chain-alcohol oxidase
MDFREESSRERVVLALIDTFFPRSHAPPTSTISTILTPKELEEFYVYRGSDSQGIALKVLEAIETCLPSDLRKELYTLFWLLNTRFGTIILGGRAAFNPIAPAAFSDLPRSNRERILLNWSQSSTTKFRKAFVGLKGLLVSTLFTRLGPDGTSPLLNLLKYNVSDPKRPVEPLPQALEAERQITAALVDLGCSSSVDGSTAGIARAAALLSCKGLSIHWPGHATTSNTITNISTPNAIISPAVVRNRPAFIISTDAIIIGSGAGGGVTAARLAEAGLRVIVLEKSSFIPAKQMSLQEGEAFSSMYDYGGLITTENGTTSVLAGSTLGGGTRINWNASFKPPVHVRKEWAQGYGLPAFESEEFDSAVEAVCRRIGVRTGFAHGGACSALAAGLQAAGMHCGDVPRNCLDPECSGHW